MNTSIPPSSPIPAQNLIDTAPVSAARADEVPASQFFADLLALRLDTNTSGSVAPESSPAQKTGKNMAPADQGLPVMPDSSVPLDMLSALMQQATASADTSRPVPAAGDTAIVLRSDDKTSTAMNPLLPREALLPAAQMLAAAQTFPTAPSSSMDTAMHPTENELAGIAASPALQTIPPAPRADMLAATLAPSPASVQVAQLAVATPLGQRQWDEDFSQKIVWLAAPGQEQRAELHLNPPDLGPLDVVLKVSGDQANAFFASPHHGVREAVEQSLPKLRELLADNGIMLGNATVSDQPSRDRRERSDATPAPAAGNLPVSERSEPSIPLRTTPLRRHDGMLDLFA